MSELFETRRDRHEAMRRRAAQPEIESKIDALRAKQPPKIRLSPDGVAAFAAARRRAMEQNLASLPDVDSALALVRRREELAHLRAVVSGAYVEELPDPAEVLPIVDRVQQAEADRRPRLQMPASASPKQVRQARARQLAKPVTAAAKAKAKQQRALVAAMKSGYVSGVRSQVEQALIASGGLADLSKPRRAVRVGTKGFHS